MPAAGMAVGANLNGVLALREVEEGEATVGIVDGLEERIADAVVEPHVHVAHRGPGGCAAEVVVDGHIHRAGGRGDCTEAEGHLHRGARAAFVEETNGGLIGGQGQAGCWFEGQEDVCGGSWGEGIEGGRAVEREPGGAVGQHHIEWARAGIAAVGEGYLVQGATAEEHGRRALGLRNAEHWQVGEDRDGEGLACREGR